MNEYQMKLNEITRKNIASTSELSMFKAIFYKLENTKKEKDALLTEAEERIQNNMPPTDDCMRKFEILKKLEEDRLTYINNRLSEVKEKETRGTDMPLRKKPEERPVLYMDDKTGLLKPYGKYAPFSHKNKPNNMRHFRNPKQG